MQQKFPSLWKNAKVLPLYKKGCVLERKNYRPESILSPLSKILEKIIYQQLYKYFNNNRLFNQNLHGYRENRSTLTALISMYDRWVKSASAGQVSFAIFLDLSSAFDLVDHTILLNKLKIYGIQEDALNWITSYLHQRFQAVWIDHVLSDFEVCDVGVPQGSILGPLLFLIYFNDLPNIVDSSVDSYADDTTITATGKTLLEIETKLTADCEKISKWMIENRLKLNPEKTHQLTLGTQQRIRSLERQLEVFVDNVALQEESTGRQLLLGCLIQADLKWRHQISDLKTCLLYTSPSPRDS